MPEHDDMVNSMINAQYPIRLTPDRHQFHLERPGWEAERLVSCAAEMKPGMVVYDLGAESGDFTALYHLWVGESGMVFPVEPSWPYWPSIHAHWVGNGLPELRGFFGGFASPETNLEPKILDSGAHKIKVMPGDVWPRAAYGPIKPDFGFRHLAQQTDHTPQMTIDRMVSHFGEAPDAIVMDIEGAELQALLGAREVMSAFKPIMWVSVHQQTMSDWYDDTLEDLLTLTSAYEYTAEKLGEGSEEYFVFR